MSAECFLAADVGQAVDFVEGIVAKEDGTIRGFDTISGSTERFGSVIEKIDDLLLSVRLAEFKEDSGKAIAHFLSGVPSTLHGDKGIALSTGNGITGVE